MRVIIFTLMLIMTYNQAYAFSKDDAPKSTIKPGDIIDYIEEQRYVLRGKYKVDVVSKFLNTSSVKVERFGNKKQVLNLKGISLSGEDIRGAIFNLAHMQSTNLSGAEANHSDFVGVDFTGANIRNANFSNADLSNARFENVNLEGVNFDGANLFKAEFIKVGGIEKDALADLKKRTRSYYVNLDREPLPDYYEFDD